jgi:hypothetical protein
MFRFIKVCAGRRGFMKGRTVRNPPALSNAEPSHTPYPRPRQRQANRGGERLRRRRLGERERRHRGPAGVGAGGELRRPQADGAHRAEYQREGAGGYRRDPCGPECGTAPACCVGATLVVARLQRRVLSRRRGHPRGVLLREATQRHDRPHPLHRLSRPSAVDTERTMASACSTAASSMWRWVTSRRDRRLQAPAFSPRASSAVIQALASAPLWAISSMMMFVSTRRGSARRESIACTRCRFASPRN